MNGILQALKALRVPVQQGEYDLHRIVEQRLTEAGVSWQHEVPLAPRCRIDLLCGTVGIEIKRGHPDRKRILQQLTRYAACDQVTALILITEKTVAVPAMINGKPVRTVCLNRLWGIAL